MVEQQIYSPAGEAFTELVLEIFRVNGCLLAEGDRMTADLNLTSARWQVMGAIGREAIPVAQIARKMGLRRQSVQRLVDILAGEGLVEFKPNPEHQRAKLVKLTEIGWQKLDRINQIEVGWANNISREMDVEKLKNAVEILQQIRKHLTACGSCEL
jgi:DNA-binding MarR family transcriptional regulator